MTVEQAIDYLKDLRSDADEFGYESDADALSLAIDSLNKQIPKNPKPLPTFLSVYYGDCPSCGNMVNDIWDAKFCSECGQALKWSDKE